MNTSTRTSLLAQLREPASDDAWVEFTSLYGSLIENWLRSQAVSQQDIEDIRQDVMVAVCSEIQKFDHNGRCLLYTSPSPRDKRQSRMPSSA